MPPKETSQERTGLVQSTEKSTDVTVKGEGGLRDRGVIIRAAERKTKKLVLLKAREEF